MPAAAFSSRCRCLCHVVCRGHHQTRQQLRHHLVPNICSQHSTEGIKPEKD